MKPKFLITPDYLIADIGKVGSSSLYVAVLESHYPEIKKPVVVGHDMSNQPSFGNWRARCPRTEEIDRPVVILVREPVDRFRSACAQSRINDVDEIITKLETGGILYRDVPAVESYHFRQTMDYVNVGGTFKLFRFPDDLDAATTLASIETPLPITNDTESNNPPKPDLTPEQLARVQAIYADDIALYESITEAGQELVIPPPPPPTPTDNDKTQKLREIATARYAEEVGGIDFNGSQIATGRDDQAMVNGAWAYLQANPEQTIRFKSKSGWVDLNLDAISAIGTAIGSHVQACFLKESTAADAVKAATTAEELKTVTY